MFVITERELYHHGVKGMKWGVRKSRTSSSGSGWRKAAKIISPVGYAAAKGIRKAANSKKSRTARNIYRNMTGSKRSSTMSRYRRNDLGRMSNKDIQDAINRMNLERQYRALTKVDYMRGQRFASNMVKTATTAKHIKF